jgi:hypothetical protein
MYVKTHSVTASVTIYIYVTCNIMFIILIIVSYPGADPGFQARGDALKKNCAERREARKFLGYFV